MTNTRATQRKAKSPMRIADALAPLTVPLNRVDVIPGNPHRGDVAAVARSLTMFGQRKPIVARKTGTTADGEPVGLVIAGNHTLLAARGLNADRIAVVFVDDDESTAKAYALADNRTSALGKDDDDALAEWVAELLAEDNGTALLRGASYDDKEIQRLLGSENIDDDFNTDPQLGDGVFRIIVECRDEAHQAELLATFDQEGLECRPLMG